MASTVLSPTLFTLAGLPQPEREYRFAPPRRWRFDYVWVDLMLALEIEGGIWRRGGGAHSRPANILRDIEKYNAGTLLGWRILRATPDMARDGSLLALLQQAAENWAGGSNGGQEC